MRSFRLLAGLLALAAAGCGGGGGGDSTTAPPETPPPTTTKNVTVGNNFFNPGDIAAATGTTVTWTWASDPTSHNVTFDDGNHSPTQSSGTYTRTFTAAGTYPYHCTIHGAAVMHGSVTVSASGGGSSGGGGGGGGGGGYGDYGAY